MVILLDRHKKPAGFTTEAHLRRLTEKHRAVIYRKFPCVAILMDADVREFDDVRSFRMSRKAWTPDAAPGRIAATGRRVTAEANIQVDGIIIRPGKKAGFRRA